jgi:hypothetical protein
MVASAKGAENSGGTERDSTDSKPKKAGNEKPTALVFWFDRPGLTPENA